MEIRRIRYFVAVAEEGSFSRAADRLWVAQPGLSTQIQRLEAELGTQLFVRHSRGADLTPAGEALLQWARDVLAAVDHALTIKDDQAEGVVGRLRLGLCSTARWARTRAVLQAYEERRPLVELTVLRAHGGTLTAAVARGELDAAVVPACFVADDLRVLHLGSEPLVAVMSNRHPLAGVPSLPVEELAGHRLLAAGDPDAVAFDRALAAVTEGLRPAPHWVASHAGADHLDGVSWADAVALTTAPEELPRGVSVRRLRPARRMPFSLCWRRGAEPPPLRGLLATVAERLAAPRTFSLPA